jgi:predicted transcriptional regulator YheO
MEAMWNGPLINALKKNVFKGRYYSMTMKVIETRVHVVEELTEKGYFNSSKKAHEVLTERLRRHSTPGHTREFGMLKEI